MDKYIKKYLDDQPTHRIVCCTDDLFQVDLSLNEVMALLTALKHGDLATYNLGVLNYGDVVEDVISLSNEPMHPRHWFRGTAFLADLENPRDVRFLDSITDVPTRSHLQHVKLQ